METELTYQIGPALLALVPVIAAIIQTLKRMPAIANYKQWLPLISVALGIAFAYMVAEPGAGPPIIEGVTLGLMASGGYDLLKTAGGNVMPPTS